MAPRLGHRLSHRRLPAGGADIASFLSYVTERRVTKHRRNSGHGAIEGVAGPEAANNAAAAGTLCPS